MTPDVMHTLGTPGAIAGWAAAWTLACSLPALLWCLVGRDIGPQLRLCALLCLTIGATWVALFGQPYAPALLHLGLGLGYFAWVGLWAVRLGRACTPWLQAGAVIPAAAIACVLVPRLVTDVKAAVLILPFGLELTLSAFSHVVEARRARNHTLGISSRAERSRRDALLFLLVNPALVDTRSGRGFQAGPPRLRRAGVLRIAQGAIAMGLAVVAVHAYHLVDVLLAQADHWPAWTLHKIQFAFAALAGLVAAYWGHSGATSVRLGWMTLLGWQVPERYRKPFLATSPVDFWRRWNLHWGAWLRRYIFDKTASHLRRQHRNGSRAHSLVLAVLATFVSSGVIHDAAAYTDSFNWPLGATVGFLFFGVGLVGWEAGVSLLTRLTGLPAGSRVLSVAGAALTWTLVCTLGWLRAHPQLPATFTGPLGLGPLGF